MIPRDEARRLARAAIHGDFMPEVLHTYTDKNGAPIYWRIRARLLDGSKWIRPMRSNGTGCELGEPEFPNGKPLYRLHELAANPGAPVWYVEGETCADALAKLGILATTAGGATSDERADYRPLADRMVTIWPDNDGPGLEHGERVAAKLRALGCLVEVIDVKLLGQPEHSDVVDWLREYPGASAAALSQLPRTKVDAAKADGNASPAAHGLEQPEQDEIARLAALSPIEYDRKRKAAAEWLGIRVDTLDSEVAKARPQDDAARDQVIAPREPWPEAVDGALLAQKLQATFRRFVVLPKHSETALALWTLCTYMADRINVAPILAVMSPEKRCGKTSLLALLNRLAHRPLAASNVSPAALFRAIEKWSPTLIIDEGDAFLRENEELRGILNSGHTRDSAFVLRCEGEEREPVRFSTWGLKAIALIGKLPDTLADRSIAIELQRKMPGERVEKLRHGADLEPLARQCLRWATDHAERMRAVKHAIPEELHDRAVDNWEPLLAVSELIGGEWPSRARQAASVLSGATADGDGTKVELLRDVQVLFAGKFADRQAVSSAELVDALIEDKAGRWSEHSHGKPLTQRQFARLLRPFGIVPYAVRIGAQVAKGYKLDAFADAFARYTPGFHPLHGYDAQSTRVVTDKRSETEIAVLRIEDPLQRPIHAGCNGVTDETPLIRGNGKIGRVEQACESAGPGADDTERI